VAVARLADQLGVDPVELRSYGRRAKTRTEHLRLVAQYLGRRPPSTLEFKELDEFLLARAMEHDSPTLLFRLACEYLISARVIRPGPVIVVKRVAHAREEAQRETFARLAHEFTDARCAALDRLLVTDPEVKTTRLRWLATGPVEASPAAVKAEVAKLAFLRGLGADALDLSVLPAERRRFLATVGRRLTAQALGRRDPQRRYPILLTLLAQSATDVLDEVVGLFDQAISAREGTACGEAIWRCRPFSSRRRKTTLSCVGAAGGRYSRILPRTCGRWSPSEMPSVGNCLAISSAVRGPGWRCSCVTRRSGTQIAHTPARARERVERYRNASAKADGLCCRWPGKAFPSDGSSGRGELAMGAPLPVRG
jgi:hypothetical protein